MLTIIKAALQEKTRRKDFLVVLGVGILFLLLISTGTASISVNGESITGFSRMLGVLISISTAIICLLSIILSLSTISNEYKRRSSHLVWVRGISQAKYHTSLAGANFLASCLAALVLYAVLIYYFVSQGQGLLIPRLLPAFLMTLISVAACTTLTSVLSLFLSPLATGIISFLIVGAGLLANSLETLSYLSEGVSSTLIRLILKISPDLSSVSAQTTAWLQGENILINPLLRVVLWAYLLSWILIIFKKKEASS